MATRIKKLGPAASPKELIAPEPAETAAKPPNPAKPIGKRIAKNPRKRINKPLGVALKTKVGKLKLNPLAKTTLQSAAKKKQLIKNGSKEIKAGRKRIKKGLSIKKEPDDAPPVLEPIFPLEENKKQPKKRGVKRNNKDVPELMDSTKIKEEIEDDVSSDLTDTSFGDNSGASKQSKRTRTAKKVKIESMETMEDVMNDLTCLIKSDEIKKETDVQSEADKMKKLSRKQKLELLKKSIKKENIENVSNRTKFDPADEKIIDMLDLNVNVLKKRSPVTNRRHSFEMCSSTPLETAEDAVKLFGEAPRSSSPRSKRKTKQDVPARKPSPYTTRSDVPAKKLRNGKERKFKNLGLLDGLHVVNTRRRRMLSDSCSKVSGYESDSSYSDLASNEPPKEDTSKPIDSLDSNSNPLPEKNVILDIMKMKFNGEVESKQPDSEFKMATVVASRFYGRRASDASPATTEPDPKEAISEKIADEAPLMVDEAGLGLGSAASEADENLTDVQADRDRDRTVAEGETVDDSALDKSEYIPMEDGPVATDCSYTVIETNEEDLHVRVDEATENVAEKESILKALGLRRSNAPEQEPVKPKPKNDNYTGTLKTVIKINRDKKKGGKGFVKSSMQKGKTKTLDEEQTEETNEKASKEKETSPSWKHGTHSSDTAGAHRKSHYSNRSNMDASSEHTSDGEAAAPQDGAIKALVIPEKASSFSIHPGRLCKDECSYCFGKFGLFDTPCHIAQMKSVDRQNKILTAEKHLTRDSCLCDACYRHVDRKSNTPSYTNKSLKRNSLVAPGPRQNHCHVLGCEKESSKILRRKWIIKMRKCICQVINLDLDNPGLHSIPICEEHYSALEHLMICAMCKRRLASNHIHYLGPETAEINKALKENGIPLALTDRPVVCKLCKCLASIILKNPKDRPEASNNFFLEYKKRLLHFNAIVRMDESAAEEPIAVPSKADRVEMLKKRKRMKYTGTSDDHTEDEQEDRVPSTGTNSRPQSRSDSPNDDYNGIDYNTLIPTIAMEVGSDSEGKKDGAMPVLNRFNDTQRESVEILRIPKGGDRSKSESLLKKLGNSVSVRQLIPGEEDLAFAGSVHFNSAREKTPDGWEKCTSVIQYDEETKKLWQELQKPYGNQSSFLRHLILLEKYFRNGDLILSPRASHHSINYSESVHNRLRAYDNIPSSAGNIQPLSMIPFNKLQTKSSSGIITSLNIPTATSTQSKAGKSSSTTAISLPKNTPITISQLNSPPLISCSSVLQPVKSKIIGQPPGLISLHPGTARPVAPVAKPPQSQKIKFPITKNWRPNLIPIDPKKKIERKTGLVQVISRGKPYHITLEDYKKMCAIKRSFEMKQKRDKEAQASKSVLVSQNSVSVLKSINARGLEIGQGAAAVKSEPMSLGDGMSEGENILEKLDKQVESLGTKLGEKALPLPKIPKSLTVIPQTVTKKSNRSSSPLLLITKNSNNGKS
ncbi:unnamed protein product [Phyllotreta striolata]|uniref:Uncharacterized protein n=1 Tax=Phyllotreta striolata TaxID=444603 RepID=A0A9N9U0W3_PHYSR|nr:unnamed protein product [Phyllotreta striolata]